MGIVIHASMRGNKVTPVIETTASQLKGKAELLGKRYRCERESAGCSEKAGHGRYRLKGIMSHNVSHNLSHS